MASATGMLNRETLAWDEELLAAVGVDAEQLPRVSDEPHEREGRTWFPAIGDGAAANLGSGAVGADVGGLTIGTSGALRVVHETDWAPWPGLFQYRLDARGPSMAAPSPTAACCGGGCGGRSICRRAGRRTRSWSGRRRRTGSCSSRSSAVTARRVVVARRGRDRRTHGRDDRGGHPPRGARGRRVPLRRDPRPAAEGRPPRRERRDAAQEPGAVPDPRGRAGTAARPLRPSPRRRPAAPPSSRWSASASRVPDCRSSACSTRARTGPKRSRRRGSGTGSSTACSSRTRPARPPARGSGRRSRSRPRRCRGREQLRRLARVRQLPHRELDHPRPLVRVRERVQHRVADPALGPVVLDGDDRPVSRPPRAASPRRPA